jgi:hypothetical protein
MTNDEHDPSQIGPGSEWSHYRVSAVGAAIAGVAAAAGATVTSNPAHWLAVAAAIAGVLGMVIAGYAISRRPKDSVTLGLAALTAVLAALATNPAWDSIRLMQFVMAATAAIIAVIVLLPQTLQRVTFSLLVLYHFAGMLSAVTSPPPTPWMTGQLWARLFRPHLEFSYVNNAYQFYSPQPGPAQILWFCITGVDGQSRWYKIPRRNEMLDPLGVEYYRRLSLTERANQNLILPPNNEVVRLRYLREDIPLHPESAQVLQYRVPNEYARHIVNGYAKHVARVLGTGRKDANGDLILVHDIKIYLTQHSMLTQPQFEKLQGQPSKADNGPYAPDTYLPYFIGQFDGAGEPMMNDFDRLMLYWLVPIIRDPATKAVKNYVITHAGSDPFDPALEWQVEP